MQRVDGTHIVEHPQINATTPANTNSTGAVSSVPPPHGTLDIGNNRIVARSTPVGTVGTAGRAPGVAGRVPAHLR